MSEQEMEELEEVEERDDLEEVEPEGPSEEELQARKELEDEARKYGWRPKDEYNRDPEGWVDAEKFLEFPQTRVKMLQDTRKTLEQELKERDERLARMEGMTKVVADRIRKQEQENFHRQLQQLENAKRHAAEEGDMDRYDRFAEQQRKLKPPEFDEPQAAPQIDPELQAYMQSDEGAWLQDQRAGALAYQTIEGDRLAQLLPPVEQAKWAAKRVKEYYPSLFPEPVQRPQARQTVDPGGLAGGRKSGRGADELPPEARQAAKDYVSEGIYKSVEEYAKDYWAQEARK